MFKHVYQGGAVVEVFSAQGKDPVAKWKLHGGSSAIQKVFDKELKGFVYCLTGCSQTVKMQLPEDGKMTLGLLHRFVVLQVNIPASKDFSIELVTTDAAHLKRRLYLSTVHKEFSATPLHARIPFFPPNQNMWAHLCIDLPSFTAELFKNADFQALDGITVSANCKLRRIFTMKAEPSAASDGAHLSQTCLVDVVPRSWLFPPEVNHVTTVVNIESLRHADVKLPNPDRAPQKTVGSVASRKAPTRDSSHIAFGTRVSGPAPQTGRSSGRPAEEGEERGPHPKARGVENLTARSEKASQGKPCNTARDAAAAFEVTGRRGSLQPHPPKDRASDRQSFKKTQAPSAAWKRPVPSVTPDAAPRGRKNENETQDTPPSRDLIGAGSGTRPLTPTEMRGHQTAESDSPESDGGGEPQLVAEEEEEEEEVEEEEVEEEEDEEGEVFAFTFTSPPPSAGGGGEGDGDRMHTQPSASCLLMKSTRSNGPRPEDDFIGSESDEDIVPQLSPELEFKEEKNEIDVEVLDERAAAGSRSPDRNETGPPQVQSEQHGTSQTARGRLRPATSRTPDPAPPSSGERVEPNAMVPTRCFSPAGTRQGQKCGPVGPAGDSRVLQQSARQSLCRTFLREVSPEALSQHKEAADRGREPRSSSSHGRLHEQEDVPQNEEDDEDELWMLVSLQREPSVEGEEECGSPGLGASQIHRCGVSLSGSGEETSARTRQSTPTGDHDQRETNPVLHSNPREPEDVISPPVLRCSQEKKADAGRNLLRDLIAGRDMPVNDGEEEEEYLNLLYDPGLNCYFDPQTGKYYKLV